MLRSGDMFFSYGMCGMYCSLFNTNGGKVVSYPLTTICENLVVLCQSS